jgi:hypothetical protein
MWYLVALVVACGLPAAMPMLQTIRLNGAVVFDAGQSKTAEGDAIRKGIKASGRLEMPHSERSMIRGATEINSTSIVRLGVVAPLNVQWSVAYPAAGFFAEVGLIRVSLLATEFASRDHVVEGAGIAQVDLPPTARSWMYDCAEHDTNNTFYSSTTTTLTPHSRHAIRIAHIGLSGDVLSTHEFQFRIGPSGTAGASDTGWAGSFVGGARTVRGSADFKAAVGSNEVITSATLYASTPGTMAWFAADKTLLHDSVLDPGYSNQPNLRSIYVAYDLQIGAKNSSKFKYDVEGHLGFGKYGYLGQWCKGNLYDKNTRTAHLGSSPECKPVAAQIVATTSMNRVLAVGTGIHGIVELSNGKTEDDSNGAMFGTAVADEGGQHRHSNRAYATTDIISSTTDFTAVLRHTNRDPDTNIWTGSVDGFAHVYSHLYHGEVYNATLERSDSGSLALKPSLSLLSDRASPPVFFSAANEFKPLTPWDTKEFPLGPLSPHSFPTIRPSEAPVAATNAWVPSISTCCCGGLPCPGCTSCVKNPPPSTPSAFSVVFDFGVNLAGSAELTIMGPTTKLKGQNIRLRYGEVLLDGIENTRTVFHPWWPCTAPFSQGAHNCANQTDEYILRGSPGQVGPVAGLGRIPM